MCETSGKNKALYHIANWTVLLLGTIHTLLYFPLFFYFFLTKSNPVVS